MRQVTVTVYKDNEGEYPTPKKVPVSVDSIIGLSGYINTTFVEQFNTDFDFPVEKVLRLTVPDKGHVYIGETEEEYLELLKEAVPTGSENESVLLWVGAGKDMEVGATSYTAEWLKNKTITDITYLNQSYKDFYSGSPEIAHDKNAGSLNFIVLGAGGVSVEGYVAVTYNS